MAHFGMSRLHEIEALVEDSRFVKTAIEEMMNSRISCATGRIRRAVQIWISGFFFRPIDLLH